VLGVELDGWAGTRCVDYEVVARPGRPLRRVVFFGPILVEWESHGAISLGSKAKLMGLTAAIVLVTVRVGPLGPIGPAVILVITSLSLYGVLTGPTLDTEHQVRGTTPRALQAR
jgi:hypothetical protein